MCRSGLSSKDRQRWKMLNSRSRIVGNGQKLSFLQQRTRCPVVHFWKQGEGNNGLRMTVKSIGDRGFRSETIEQFPPKQPPPKLPVCPKCCCSLLPIRHQIRDAFLRQAAAGLSRLSLRGKEVVATRQAHVRHNRTGRETATQN